MAFLREGPKRSRISAFVIGKGDVFEYFVVKQSVSKMTAGNLNGTIKQPAIIQKRKKLKQSVLAFWN